MNRRTALPRLDEQATDKPSPVPEKHAKAAPKASGAAGGPRTKGLLAAAPGRPFVAGEAAKEIGKACLFTSTADQERPDESRLVAAHASYPLGSHVRMTNLGNEKSVEVRIVDRFPRASGRMTSVSDEAVRQLDFVKSGTAEVSVEPAP